MINLNKNGLILLILAIAVIMQVYSSEIRHYSLLESEQKKDVFIWEEMTSQPFDELIISWDAKRPQQGAYFIQASLLTTEWSPWIDYAVWGACDQYTFKQHFPQSGLQVYQDAIEVLQDKKAIGFKIRVIAEGEAHLIQFRTLHASITDRKTHCIDSEFQENVCIHLTLNGISQMALPDERRMRLCSPTSTTAVIHFLSKSQYLSPLEFAPYVRDSAFDIYGNWILNTAQASHELGEPWHCFVARLGSFNQVIEQLTQGYPLIVSVKGPLNGSPFPYESGHLLVVKGYDSETQQVFCMDPAFPTNELTQVQYSLNDFLAAWRRRQGLSYIFYRHSNPFRREYSN